MPISTTATSGFSSIAFVRPHGHSLPRRPLSSRVGSGGPPVHRGAPTRGRQRSECEVFSRSFLSERYRYADCCAATGGINLKPTADQLHSLLHAVDTNTYLESVLLFPSRHPGRGSWARVADFQREIRVAMNSYLRSLTS